MTYAKFYVYILIIEETRVIYVKSSGFEKKEETCIFTIYTNVIFLVTDDVQITKIVKLYKNLIIIFVHIYILNIFDKCDLIPIK